jgi:aspartyl-tRNA(Asn)/glutamyl-tRNA(Gln) amidotransferase subunit B
MGLATECKVARKSIFARKNYFYPDLPKGYQISQFETPICYEGKIHIELDEYDKTIGLTRIHMEEDSGKSIHDIDPFHTLIDLNRAGVPLLEMVSEPEFKDGTEAYNYLNEMRKLVRYLDISDGNMEEGSLRCDVNISVKPIGRKKFGTKVEVKNLNSFRSVQKSIDYEIKRQVALIDSGGTVTQQTMTFDAANNRTQVLRAKEDAHDYRYFNEPDLQPIIVKQDYIKNIKKDLPALPKELYAKYRKLKLSEYDANLLTESKELAQYYEAIIEYTKNYKGAANWVMGSIKSYLNEKAISISEFSMDPQTIAELQDLIDSNKVSNSAANGDLFKALLEKPEAKPKDLALEMNLIQESNEGELMAFVKEALAKYPDKVEAYRKGKKGVLGLFMGEVMKLSKGKADPKVASKLVQQELEK